MTLQHTRVVRDRVLMNVLRMLGELHSWVSCYHADDRGMLFALEDPQRQTLAIRIAETVLVQLGAEPSQPQNPRFNKTRRALARLQPKGPRGVRKKDLAKAEAIDGE